MPNPDQVAHTGAGLSTESPAPASDACGLTEVAGAGHSHGADVAGDPHVPGAIGSSWIARPQERAAEAMRLETSGVGALTCA